MKVKVLCRNPDDYIRETKLDIHKVPRNYDPALHPFEGPREYTRALNSVKIERLLAKPFVGSLSGHKDGIQCIINHPKKLSVIASGCCDGQIKLWDLPRKTCTRTIQAHTGFVRGLCFPTDGTTFISIGDDKSIKYWKYDVAGDDEDDAEPTSTAISTTILTGISHHWSLPMFATCGEKLLLWDPTRAEPVKQYKWGNDNLTSLKFNLVETNIIASCASDRSIILYDIRQSEPIRKVTLALRTNAIAWNPTEAFVFTAANEDYNLHTFDMRKLKRSLCVHSSHVSAVIDVAYSPTGKEFVSGSYDKSVRIFESHLPYSREVYHTKRMQRLQCVLYSMDNKYVLCGSDEMNIRIWKANAAEKLGLMTPRERVALEYGDKLKEKFMHHPKVRRIAKHRHVPRHIHHGTKEKKIMTESRKRKDANRRANTKPGTIPFVSERVKHIVEEHK